MGDPKVGMSLQIYRIFAHLPRALTFTPMKETQGGREGAAVEYYTTKLEKVAVSLTQARRRRAALAWVRAGAILVALGAGYVAYQYQEPWWVLVVVAGLAAFGRVVSLDVNNNGRIRRLEGLDTLVRQEREGVTDLSGDMPYGEDHPYAYDLDIFGRGSLYKMVNRCHSEPGRQMLADWLIEPADRETILQRQEAVKELKYDPDGLFDLAALCRDTPLTLKTGERIGRWLRNIHTPFKERYWTWMRWGYPVVTLGLLGFYIGGMIPASVFGLCCIVFLAVSSAISKRVIESYIVLSGIVGEIGSLSEGVSLIENRGPQTPLTQRLQNNLKTPKSAAQEIKALDGLLHRFDYRLNPFVFLPLNAFLMWDLWQMHGLNQWRERNREGVDRWIETLAEMEALGSLALLHFNRPEWCFPEIARDEPAGGSSKTFAAKKLGHPLIPKAKRITNDFSTQGAGQLELVTGSNMAGKSTFLRTVGINMVMAMAGAPVCAEACRLSTVLVVSSMRIADNLEDSTSTFYAELKKLKSIIDRVKRREHVFILLDEILRGTNSRDRLAGSQALVRQLVRDGAAGIVATHDLELAQMETELPGHVHNYYFDVQFEGDELHFDYTLRKGVCTTRNAEVLMRQIGIELPSA
jgi:hypothetical protein